MGNMIIANLDNLLVLALLLIALGYALARTQLAQDKFDEEKENKNQ